jgi:hypothetical protein
MKLRLLPGLTWLVAVTTTLWVILLIVDQVARPPIHTLSERIAALEANQALFTINYLNAALITLFTVMLLAAYLTQLHDRSPLWTAIGAAFVPMYGLANLAVYLSQIFVVPGLLDLYHQPETTLLGETLLGLALHDWPGSAAGFVNALAYAALGVASLVVGLLLSRGRGLLRAGGGLLALSGGFSLAALFGLRVPALAALTLVSGAVYLLALVLLGIELTRRPEALSLPPDSAPVGA